MKHMKPFIFTAAFICCMLFAGCESRTKVYVCKTNKSVFHFSECCEGLDDCRDGVYLIPLDEARKKGMYRCTDCEFFYEDYKVKIVF